MDEFGETYESGVELSNCSYEPNVVDNFPDMSSIDDSGSFDEQIDSYGELDSPTSETVPEFPEIDQEYEFVELADDVTPGDIDIKAEVFPDMDSAEPNGLDSAASECSEVIKSDDIVEWEEVEPSEVVEWEEAGEGDNAAFMPQEIDEYDETAQDAKVLTLDQDVQWQQGNAAIDRTIDAMRDDLHDKGYSDEAQIDAILSQNKMSMMEELSQNIQGNLSYSYEMPTFQEQGDQAEISLEGATSDVDMNDLPGNTGPAAGEQLEAENTPSIPGFEILEADSDQPANYEANSIEVDEATMPSELPNEPFGGQWAKDMSEIQQGVIDQAKSDYSELTNWAVANADRIEQSSDVLVWDEGSSLEDGGNVLSDDGVENTSGGHSSTYDETSFEKEMVNQLESIGEMPPVIPLDNKGWDELKDVPFAGDIDEADGLEIHQEPDSETEWVVTEKMAPEEAVEGSSWDELKDVPFSGLNNGETAEGFESENPLEDDPHSMWPESLDVGEEGFSEANLQESSEISNQLSEIYSVDDGHELTDPGLEIASADESVEGIQVGTIDDVGNWLGEVNPNYDAFDINSPYSNNCGSCAWAVEQRLEGAGTPIATAENIGTIEEMNALTGMEQVQMTPDEIRDTLTGMGPGSHAIIGIDRSEGPGHWFNAYCPDGVHVYAIDGQTGEINDWPPDYGDVVNWDMSIKKER